MSDTDRKVRELKIDVTDAHTAPFYWLNGIPPNGEYHFIEKSYADALSAELDLERQRLRVALREQNISNEMRNEALTRVRELEAERDSYMKEAHDWHERNEALEKQLAESTAKVAEFEELTHITSESSYRAKAKRWQSEVTSLQSRLEQSEAKLAECQRRWQHEIDERFLVERKLKAAEAKLEYPPFKNLAKQNAEAMQWAQRLATSSSETVEGVDIRAEFEQWKRSVGCELRCLS